MSGIIDTVGAKSGIVGSDVYPAGHVIQTITAHSATEVYAAGNSYVSITNMSGAITPKKDNSKIIVHMEMGGQLKAEAWGSVYIKVTGTATSIVMETQNYAHSSVNDGEWMPFPISVLAVDTPGTDSVEQTYQLHVRTGADGTAADLRINAPGGAATNRATIILTEIAQ